jgi:hypothetical protein
LVFHSLIVASLRSCANLFASFYEAMLYVLP